MCLPGKVQLAGHFITTITTAGFFLITHQPQQKHRRSIQPCFLMHRQYNCYTTQCMFVCDTKCKCDSTGKPLTSSVCVHQLLTIYSMFIISVVFKTISLIKIHMSTYQCGRIQLHTNPSITHISRLMDYSTLTFDLSLLASHEVAC